MEHSCLFLDMFLDTFLRGSWVRTYPENEHCVCLRCGSHWWRRSPEWCEAWRCTLSGACGNNLLSWTPNDTRTAGCKVQNKALETLKLKNDWDNVAMMITLFNLGFVEHGGGAKGSTDRSSILLHSCVRISAARLWYSTWAWTNAASWLTCSICGRKMFRVDLWHPKLVDGFVGCTCFRLLMPWDVLKATDWRVFSGVN